MTTEKNEQANLPPLKNEEMLEKPKEEKRVSHEEPKLLNDQKMNELTNDLKRLQAEFQNYKRRVDREKEDMITFANANLITQLLVVVDEFEIALQHVKDKGIEMVYINFLSLLRANGLKEMNDEKFDPYRHEAVKQVEGDEDGRIVEILKKGYVLNGNVIRHALVVVSKKR